MMHLSRRQVLAMMAAAVLQPRTPGVRPAMIPRSARPEDREMPLAGFLDYLTPIDRFFVRSHVYTPRIDVASWQLTVDGHVTGPVQLTMADLRRMPLVDIVSVLECAGNGRRFYEPSVAGLQWGHGAVGNARWRGVRLKDVLTRAAVRAGARDVRFNGVDVPIGTMPDFQRSLPIAKALDANTLLAFEMNGQPLPIEHGFPLRVVAPGWAGDSWIKWVTSITVLDREDDGFWMARAYRRPIDVVAPGTAVPLERTQPVTSLRVKSVIATPVDGDVISVGAMTTIRGAAWSGDAGPVTAVDVSLDGGRSWSPATLPRNQRTDFGWRLWEYRWRPAGGGAHTILARARDAAGSVQPMEQQWNPSGYQWNVVPRVTIDVGRNGAPASSPTSPSEAQPIEPPAPFKSACLACHQDDVIRQQRLTRAQWDAELTKMIGWGARVNEQERALLLDYLATSFPPRP
jgi:DMSO/TMAO reductase YedYZ molybdopterin-dependent catalytic subunit